MMLNKLLNSTVKCVFFKIEWIRIFRAKCKGFEIVRDSLHHTIWFFVPFRFVSFFFFCFACSNYFQFTHLSSSPLSFHIFFSLAFYVYFFGVAKCGQWKWTKDLDIEFSIARYIWNSIARFMHECEFRNPKWAHKQFRKLWCLAGKLRLIDVTKANHAIEWRILINLLLVPFSLGIFLR